MLRVTEHCSLLLTVADGKVANKQKLSNFVKLKDKLDGVAPLTADLPLLKLHQRAKSTPSVKWPLLLNHLWDFDALRDLESS